VSDKKISSEVLEDLQRATFNYFIHESNPLNGLVVDKTQPGAPASIAAVGLALSSYPVGVERGFIPRADAIQRTLATLRFSIKAFRAPTPMPPDTKGSITTFST
jgi:hypothetical protein